MPEVIRSVKPVQVRCSECGCLLFELADDIIVHKATHHGHEHTNLIPLSMLAGTIIALPSGQTVRLARG